MDTPEQSTIDKEIASITQRINRESFHGLPHNTAEDLRRHHKPEKRLDFFKKILYNLELQRAEPDWVIVCKQDQNDHDEIWKHKDPGPDFTSADNMLGKLLSSYLTKGVSHSIRRIVDRRRQYKPRSW